MFVCTGHASAMHADTRPCMLLIPRTEAGTIPRDQWRVDKAKDVIQEAYMGMLRSGGSGRGFMWHSPRDDTPEVASGSGAPNTARGCSGGNACHAVPAGTFVHAGGGVNGNSMAGAHAGPSPNGAGGSLIAAAASAAAAAARANTQVYASVHKAYPGVRCACILPAPLQGLSGASSTHTRLCLPSPANAF